MHHRIVHCDSPFVLIHILIAPATCGLLTPNHPLFVSKLPPSFASDPKVPKRQCRTQLHNVCHINDIVSNEVIQCNQNEIQMSSRFVTISSDSFAFCFGSLAAKRDLEQREFKTPPKA